MQKSRPATRRKLIERIERRRNSRVIALVTNIRQFGAGEIADIMLPWLVDQLRRIGHVERLDLFLVTFG